jgi:NADH dehydrogenase [ubiquinone] 1 alpha subcomplex assembly factor 6
VAEALSYCAAEVRRADYDRFLATLFAPAPARESLFALYAFNHEIAKVRETVTEPMLGRIRLQWWREALDGVYAGAPRAHPVAQALADAVRAHNLTRAHLERLLDAREFDLEGRAPATLAELEGYAESTAATLLWLAAEALGARAEATRAALRPLGIAWALAGLVRAIPFHARARRQYVPQEVAREAGLSERILFGLERAPALSRSAARLAEAAAAQLDAARRAATGIEPQARPLLLFASLARAYLARLGRHGHDPLAPDLEPARAAKVLRLWWAARSGRYWS